VDYQGTIYALLRAVGFKMVMLTQRLLQEKGASEIDTYAIYRYALIPAVAWSLVFVREEDINFIFHTPKLLIIFGALIVLWNLQALIISFVINSTSSMVLFTTIFSMLNLPLYLGFGTFFNGDIPNIFNIAAILILLVAFLINPAHHHENLRPRLSKPLYVIALLILAKVSCDTVLDGITREGLQQVHPTVFLGVFGVTTLSVCAIISRFYVRQRFREAEIMKEKQWLALSIPMIWFAASIPEIFALAALPIYTVISIGAVTFGMDTFSDFVHKRIRLNLQTGSFITLVLAGTILAVLSI
jgi:hypothetical protein